MPVRIKDETYYSASEACRNVGISRSMLYLWLRQGVLRKHERNDMKGWRLFTEAQINVLKGEAGRVR